MDSTHEVNDQHTLDLEPFFRGCNYSPDYQGTSNVNVDYIDSEQSSSYSEKEKKNTGRYDKNISNGSNSHPSILESHNSASQVFNGNQDTPNGFRAQVDYLDSNVSEQGSAYSDKEKKNTGIYDKNISNGSNSHPSIFESHNSASQVLNGNHDTPNGFRAQVDDPNSNVSEQGSAYSDKEKDNGLYGNSKKRKRIKKIGSKSKKGRIFRLRYNRPKEVTYCYLEAIKFYKEKGSLEFIRQFADFNTREKFRKSKKNIPNNYFKPFMLWMSKVNKEDLIEKQLKFCDNAVNLGTFASLAEAVLTKTARDFQYLFYDEFKNFLNHTLDLNFTNINHVSKSPSLDIYLWISIKAIIENPWDHYHKKNLEEIAYVTLKNYVTV